MKTLRGASALYTTTGYALNAGDLANIAVDAGQQIGPLTVDGVGSEKFTYSAFVQIIASAVGKDVRFVRTPAWLGLLLGQLIGHFIRDVSLSRDEYTGLRNNLFTSDQLPNGATRFTEWIRKKGQGVGQVYVSELGGYFRWKAGN